MIPQSSKRLRKLHAVQSSFCKSAPPVQAACFRLNLPRISHIGVFSLCQVGTASLRAHRGEIGEAVDRLCGFTAAAQTSTCPRCSSPPPSFTIKQFQDNPSRCVLPRASQINQVRRFTPDPNPIPPTPKNKKTKQKNPSKIKTCSP